MSYPVTPTLSVDAAQARLTLVAVFEELIRFVGVVGAVVSGVVVICVNFHFCCAFPLSVHCCTLAPSAEEPPVTSSALPLLLEINL
ncbi:hypothetical protein D3C75_1066440 [compost metagenome]